MSDALPRHLEIMRETFNADVRMAVRDGIQPAELAAFAAALAEDIIMHMPKKLRSFAIELIVENLGQSVKARTAAGE